MSEEQISGYDAIDFDGTERRANYRTVAYREDMLCVFERKDAAAIIYQIIYRWETEVKREMVLSEINRRKKAGLTPLTPDEVESMMWVYMSYNDFVRESGHAMGYNTVIRMLDYLVNTMKVVEQRRNHNPHYPDYEYRINKEVVKNLLKALPVQPPFVPKVPKKKEDSTQMGTREIDSTQQGTRSTQQGTATTHLGREVYPNGGTSHTTHSNTHTTQSPVSFTDEKKQEKEIFLPPTKSPSQENGKPKRTYTKKPKQPHTFTLQGRACIDAWNACHIVPCSEAYEQEHSKGFEDFALLVEQSNGKIQLTDIKRVIDDLDEREYKGKYYYRGRVTPELVVKEAPGVLTASSKPTKPTNGHPTKIIDGKIVETDRHGIQVPDRDKLAEASKHNLENGLANLAAKRGITVEELKAQFLSRSAHT